ncbi:MAG TPA: hypothetical protein VM845_04180 [Burkholderiaceae bacterium]|nr:hypothetical protein [Burkholderiaceae bacterium]
MSTPHTTLAAYYQSQKALVCELEVQPWVCEFWPEAELSKYNLEYEVSIYAPGYFGFATSGGGEMYALSPAGKVVCLAFIGMSPQEELVVAESWSAFESMLRDAL